VTIKEALSLALVALLASTRPALALRSCRSALSLRSLVLLLRTRRRPAWAFCPRPSRVTAAALDVTQLLLGLRLRPRLLCRLLRPHLGAARLHIGALLARS